MNFLLHRHLAAGELGVVEGVGAMLPDLWRMLDRRLRARRVDSDAAPESVAALLVGVEHHLRIDRWFHHDPLFIEGERKLAAAFRDANFQARRMGLLAHVAWELCLDGALLHQVGVSETLAALSQGFEAVRGPSLEATTALQAPPSLAHDELEGLHRRLDRLFDRLLTSDWIPGYQDAVGIAHRLGGVRIRLALDPLDPDDHRKLVDRLEPALLEAREVLEPWLEGWARRLADRHPVAADRQSDPQAL